MSHKPTVFIGNIIHCTKLFELELIENGFLVVDKNKIVGIGRKEALHIIKSELKISETEDVVLSSSQLLLPGLIDTHIHAPQYPNSGLGYDKPLLEWLDCYTYNLEKKYKDDDLSRRVYNSVVKKTLSNGTTTACYFGSLFLSSTMILVDSVIQFGQRALVGKINMTKLAPEDYLDLSPESSIQDTIKFIKDVKEKNNDLVKPIITPRFALSVDAALMLKLGQIAEQTGLHIQTHISENIAECELVKETYTCGSYAKVYDDAKLLTPKTVLAHGIHLSDEECELLAKRGSSIAHCPESNTCLRSGLCNVRRLMQFGIDVGLGTDVSGGASPSIISTMRSAIETSIHLSYNNLKGYNPLSWKEAFYLATLGGAKVLALDSQIGNFLIGKDFDAIVVDMNRENGSCDHLMEYTPLEVLQKFVYLGDDRNVVKVYVGGKLVKQL